MEAGIRHSESAPLQGERPARPPAADLHSVLNALNRIAARCMARDVPEDPVLFALSDYLSAALRQSASEHVCISQEILVLSSYVELEALLSRSEISVDPQCSATDRPIPRGLLSCAGAALLRARRPRQGSAWTLRLDSDRSDHGIRFQVRLTGRGPAQGIDAHRALSECRRDLGASNRAVAVSLVELESGAGLQLTLPVH